METFLRGQSSCLAPPLGVTKFMKINALSLATFLVLLKSDLDIQPTHFCLFSQSSSSASALGGAKFITFIAMYFITVVLFKSDLIVQQTHLWFVVKC